MYDPRHNPNPRPISPSSQYNPGTHSPSKLTRENLRRFEQEQEGIAREKRITTTPIPPKSPVQNVERGQVHQVFVLDRVVDMDVMKEDTKYRCCCRCTTVHKGALWVGFIEALISLTALIVVIVNYARLGRNYLDHFVATVCICVGYVLVLTFHFCGLQSKSSWMLIPNLLAQLISMILLVVTSILIGINLTAQDQSPLVIWAGWGPLYGDLAREAGMSLFTVGAVLIGACCLAFVLYVWFFYICVMCYRYLNERKRKRRGLVYNETGGSTAKMTSTANTPVPK